MVGCPGAQINLSVKSAIRLPANVWLERDIPELQSKTWKLGRKGVSRAKGGRKAYEVVAVLHPKAMRSPQSFFGRQKVVVEPGKKVVLHVTMQKDPRAQYPTVTSQLKLQSHRREPLF